MIDLRITALAGLHAARRGRHVPNRPQAAPAALRSPPDGEADRPHAARSSSCCCSPSLLITALLVGVALRAVFQYDVADDAKPRRGGARAHACRARRSRWPSAAPPWSAPARQSLVLNDAVLRRRFDDAARDARQVLERLADNGLRPPGLDKWRAQLDVIEGADERRRRHRARARNARWPCSSASSTRSTPTSRSRRSSLIETQNNALRPSASRPRARG